MNIQVDSTSSKLASAMLNLKIRPRAVVGYGVKIFHPSPPNYVIRSPGRDGNGKSGWRNGHQSYLPPLLQMLYVGWVSVDLNLTSRVLSGLSGFLPPQNRLPFEGYALAWECAFPLLPFREPNLEINEINKRLEKSTIPP